MTRLYQATWAALTLLLISNSLASDPDAFYCKFGLNHTLCKYNGIGANCNNIIRVRGVSDLDKQFIVDDHNAYRSRISMGQEHRGVNGSQPPAANMLSMSWDEELAKIAQRHADQCTFEHDCAKCRMIDRFKTGQNLFITFDSGYNERSEWDRAMKSWYDEVKDVNPRHIKPFKFFPPTGHYTQMVWWNTRKIGCGLTMFFEDPWWKKLYTCNYGPGGNILETQMYEIGESCSKCPRDTICSNKFPGICEINEQAISPGGNFHTDNDLGFSRNDFRFFNTAQPNKRIQVLKIAPDNRKLASNLRDILTKFGGEVMPKNVGTKHDQDNKKPNQRIPSNNSKRPFIEERDEIYSSIQSVVFSNQKFPPPHIPAGIIEIPKVNLFQEVPANVWISNIANPPFIRQHINHRPFTMIPPLSIVTQLNGNPHFQTMPSENNSPISNLLQSMLQPYNPDIGLINVGNADGNPTTVVKTSQIEKTTPMIEKVTPHREINSPTEEISTQTEEMNPLTNEEHHSMIEIQSNDKDSQTTDTRFTNSERNPVPSQRDTVQDMLVNGKKHPSLINNQLHDPDTPQSTNSEKNDPERNDFFPSLDEITISDIMSENKEILPTEIVLAEKGINNTSPSLFEKLAEDGQAISNIDENSQQITNDNQSITPHSNDVTIPAAVLQLLPKDVLDTIARLTNIYKRNQFENPLTSEDQPNSNNQHLKEMRTGRITERLSGGQNIRETLLIDDVKHSNSLQAPEENKVKVDVKTAIEALQKGNKVPNSKVIRPTSMMDLRNILENTPEGVEPLVLYRAANGELVEIDPKTL